MLKRNLLYGKTNIFLGIVIYSTPMTLVIFSLSKKEMKVESSHHGASRKIKKPTEKISNIFGGFFLKLSSQLVVRAAVATFKLS